MLRLVVSCCLVVLFIGVSKAKAEDGYSLWLRYFLIEDNKYLNQVKSSLQYLHFPTQNPTLQVAKKELHLALKGLMNFSPSPTTQITQNGTLLIGTPKENPLIKSQALTNTLQTLNAEGFVIRSQIINQKKCIFITANTDIGVLYGVFHFLKLIQTRQSLDNLDVISQPSINYRLLNHWDNLDRTVERGYAGFSLWDWQRLPDYLDVRYTDYARANASIGINGTVITNVNANAQILTPFFLKKVAALADVFRPYGIKVYLTARFSAPIEIGGLKTADPLDPQVQAWWNAKAKEIYQFIPDFGGFLVKANSEGQPGPQNYGRNHAQGANMLARAVKPFGGIVMWRAFVYDNEVPDDRAKQAHQEFVPLDEQFDENVIIQVKNGAIDFQPREPFHPLFGAMPKTPMMMEFQLTQEYLGFATHLVYLAPLFRECLLSDTYAKGKGSTVAKVINGKLNNHKHTGIAGVANIGNDRNWCGHLFAQSNWYAFGRLAWNPEETSEQIAADWLKMTFSNDATFINPAQKIMLASHEATVNYMTPLGLHHILGWSHHYGPAPWIKDKHRADWTSVYYHQASATGIGFDRTAKGSNALSQYAKEVQQQWENTKTCPEKYLLWFHHVSWDYAMQSGKTLWETLVDKYYEGVQEVRLMQKTWASLEGKIDEERHQHVTMLLAIQEKEAVWWRNACLLYFQTFSKKSIDKEEQPNQNLEYYQNLDFKFVPGN